MNHLGPAVRLVRAIERGTRRRKEIPGAVLVVAVTAALLVIPPGGAGASGACDASVSWGSIEPAATGDAGIQTLKLTSSSPGELRGTGTLFVRIGLQEGTEIERVLIDTDGDWMTGMWTAQSDLSAAGWDVLVDPWSNLYRHGGNPRTWSWSALAGAGVERVSSKSAMVFCIPVAAFEGRTKRVRVAVENEDVSLPLRFLPGVPYPETSDGPAAEPVQLPGRLVFNYSGSPWNIRRCSSKPRPLACAARAYSKVRHLVLGAGLEEPDRGGHEKTGKLIRKIRKRTKNLGITTEIWGYISIVGPSKDADGSRSATYSVSEFLARAAAWKEMGVTGIFIDEFDICEPNYEHCQEGPKGPVRITRAHQVAVVEGVHALGLAVFANGNSPQDAMADHNGLSSALGAGFGQRPADMYLLENPTVLDGEFHTGIDFEANRSKFLNALRLRQATGTRIAVLDSMDVTIPDGASSWPEYRVGWWRAAQASASAYAFFSSTQGHHGNVPLLDPPDDALSGYAGRWKANGLTVKANGWTVLRAVEDCRGDVIGKVTVARTAKDGTSSGHYEQISEPSDACA